MPDSFRTTTFLAASPRQVYAAWLDADGHAAMTGGAAQVDPRIGGKFQAWDGYIQGTTIALEPARRILQRWRTTEFPENAGDSLVDVRLEPEGEGTRLTLRHSEIPEGQGPSYLQGWDSYYFEPMARYFAAPKKTPARKASAKKAPAKKAPAKKAPAKKAPAKKAPAKKAPARKAPARKAPARKAPAKKAPARKAPARKAPAKKAPARKTPAKKTAPRGRR